MDIMKVRESTLLILDWLIMQRTGGELRTYRRNHEGELCILHR